ncbi:MAG: cation-translocating P-type ATPase [Peptoniphilaceae bacterium]|nr:cation-translocating P-type ATPase [Peptoniphilaceae bacterium]MDD7383648.1 cation-translocating P-type ATPase [Peptoniphilaceae bacterium]MDY3737819.1 cation-translocating P-type ATPase [Peptoniphilaceae bacterium]
MDWYKGSIQSVVEELKSDKVRGLSSDEANKRLQKYGKNELESKKKKSLGKKIAEQIIDPMVIILIIASIISAITDDLIECIIILSIVVINAIMSIIQEGKAENSIEALQKLSSPEAKVYRDGKITKVKSSDVVIGDIVSLETGDIIPADLRIISSSNLKIDESSLTGESVAVEKNASVEYSTDQGIGDRENYAFSSTIVTYGHGKGIICATARDTEIGKIATSLDSYEEEETPLQKKLNGLSKFLAVVILLVCIGVFAVGFIRSEMTILDNLMISVSLAVAAIPEGLTAIVTIVLSLGMNRMAQKNAIVKKLLSVETLGTTTYICTDKTGTLTQNEMTVTKVFSDFKEYNVEGRGYAPKGDIRYKDEIVNENDSIKKLMKISTLCNDADLITKNGLYEIIGDPTEGAMLSLSEKWGINQEELEKKYPRLKEIPFDSDRKMMTTFHNIGSKFISATKGAPDVMIKRCNKILNDGEIVDFDESLKEKVLEENSNLAKNALRVMAYAYREFENIEDLEITSENIENNMIFVGLTGMIDPPRDGVKEAVLECNNAGINVIMITGDYLDTAFAIAEDLGIAQSKEQAIMGHELNDMTEDEIRRIVKEKNVFARVSPENKVQIVKALKQNDQITAMTGDGVNDAPAIKNADIGISMGITGTDVAKDTAQVILTDDNFATIVNAVEEGRIIYSNIKKFVSFLLSCNIAEVLIVFLSILFGLPSPLTAIQLLWLNLITDAFPALALGVEPGEKDIMKNPPRDPKEAILDKDLKISLIVQSVAITTTVLLSYILGLNLLFPNNIKGAHTIVFATLITSELLRAHTVRSSKFTLKELGIFSNKKLIWATIGSFILLILVMYVPFLRVLFELEFISWQWIIVIILASLPLVIGEIHKSIKK